MKNTGGLAQLARAPALHAGGHRFESVILHKYYNLFFYVGLVLEMVQIHSQHFSLNEKKFFEILNNIIRAKNYQEHSVDALALRGDEGRDKLR